MGILKAMQVPVIDISLLLHRDSRARSLIIQKIREACRSTGIFHVVNHGVPETVMKEALDVSAKYFDLKPEMKEEDTSGDIFKPVRYSRVQEGAKGIGRDFLKLYNNQDFLDLWPKNPSDFREKIKLYATEVRKLGIEIVGAIMESLSLKATYLKENIEQGVHMVVLNNYPPTSPGFGSEFTIGAPPHSDHSIITVLLQTSSGLQVMDRTDHSWKIVPEIKGSFLVIVGDHLEVLSNARYGSAFHQAVHESSRNRRQTIASLHSLGMDEILETPDELVDEEHPKQYKGSSVRDYLKHLASESSKPFLETLRIHQN